MWCPKIGLFQSLVSICVCSFFLVPSTSRIANTTRNIFLVTLPGQTEAGSIRNLPINHVFMSFPSLAFVCLRCLHKHPNVCMSIRTKLLNLQKNSKRRRKGGQTTAMPWGAGVPHGCGALWIPWPLLSWLMAALHQYKK